MENENYELDAIAYHEAGHAVMAFLIGTPIKYATVIPDKEYIGMVRISPRYKVEDVMSLSPIDWKMQKIIESDIMVKLAGQLAEAKYLGKEIDDVLTDHETSVSMMDNIVSSDEELDAYYDWLTIRTRNFIVSPRNWPIVEAVAKELLIHKQLSGRKVRRIILQTFEDEFIKFKQSLNVK